MQFAFGVCIGEITGAVFGFLVAAMMVASKEKGK